MPKAKKMHPIIKIITLIIKTIKKHQCTFLGVTTYFSISIVIVWIGQIAISEWVVKSSSNPIIALWSIGIFLSSLIYLLIKLSRSLKISLFKIDLEIAQEKIACFFSLPNWVIFILLLIGLTGGIILTRPLCQPPVVLVSARYEENGNTKQISPGGTFDTLLASSAIFEASAKNTATIVCKWEYEGNAILSREPQDGCTVRIAFSQEPAQIGVVTLIATDNQCSQRNVFPFNVETK